MSSILRWAGGRAEAEPQAPVSPHFPATLGRFDELLHLPPIDRLPGREVPIQSSDPDSSIPGHRLEARLGAALAEDRLCRLKHTFAIANGIDARLSRALVRQPHAERTSIGA